MDLLSKLEKIFHLSKDSHKEDVVELADKRYCAVINDNPTFFDTKEAMFAGIEEFSRFNAIYSLNMFRYDMYNLLK